MSVVRLELVRNRPPWSYTARRPFSVSRFRPVVSSHDDDRTRPLKIQVLLIAGRMFCGILVFSLTGGLGRRRGSICGKVSRPVIGGLVPDAATTHTEHMTTRAKTVTDLIFIRTILSFQRSASPESIRKDDRTDHPTKDGLQSHRLFRSLPVERCGT